MDQADRDRVGAIMDEEFPGGPLDLVIDDASHLLAESRLSFESLFPRLRPGGLFVIEDWNGKHLLSDRMLTTMQSQSKSERNASERQIGERVVSDGIPPIPLYRLVVELMLARASSGHAVEEINIDEFWTVIRRGPAELDPATFRVADLYHDHFGILGR